MKVFIKNDKGERVECDYVQVKFRGKHVGYVHAVYWTIYIEGKISGSELLELAGYLPTTDMLRYSSNGESIKFISENILYA